MSDADGWISLPALIPGASYRVRVVPRRGPPTFRKEVTVKPGETVDLGEIVVESGPGPKSVGLSGPTRVGSDRTEWVWKARRTSRHGIRWRRANQYLAWG